MIGQCWKDKAKGIFIVNNDRGLHTRPSTELVKCASNFKSHLKLVYRKKEVNAKSLLGVLTLAAAKGARIKIEASGIDAEEAIETLVALAKLNFNVHY
jgi:phosphocarrier protein